MLSNQTRNDMTMNNEEEKETPKADADLTNTLDSIERMLSLSPNENVLKNLLDVVKSNEGVSENPDQISRLDKLKVKITAKLGGRISENASCGATSSCCIATVAQPMMKNKKKNKVKPIRRKMLGIDALSFLECVNQDIPASIEIRGTAFKTHYVGKHPVLMTNECVVPVIGKENIGKFIKRFYLTGNDFEVCESVISPVDFLIMNSKVICEADAKFDDKKAQDEKDDPQIDANLRNQVGRQTIATVDRKKPNDMNNTLSDTGDNDNLKTNQELVGIDDSDPTQKKYVVKDPQTGKISVKRQSEVAIQNEAVKYYKKPLLESDLEETKASRFNQHLDNREQSFATISAERTNDDVKNKFGYDEKISNDASKEEKEQNQRGKNKFTAFNNRRTKKLKAILDHFGLKGYIRTKGGFKELKSKKVNEENSVFVPNITKDMAIRIGKMFNQDSIFFKEKGSDVIEELATNEDKIKAMKNDNKKDAKIGDKTGLVMYCCQGRTNNNLDDTFYTRPIKSSKKFSFNKYREYGIRNQPLEQRYESDFQNQEELDAYRDEIRKENPQTYKIKDE